MATKAVDATIGVDQDGQQIRPYVRRPRHRWESFDSTDPEEQEAYGGFAAKLRVDASAGEVAVMEAALKESEDQFWQCVRPRIVAWNALCADINDVETPIPAPGDHEDNWQAVYALERPLVVWLASAVRMAHWSATVRDHLAVTRADARAKALHPPAAADATETDKETGPAQEVKDAQS